MRRLMHIAAAAIAGLALAAPFARAEEYPARPVRIMVGFAPGSSADITSRTLGQRMSQILGQQFVVEIKPGAASGVAAEFTARAPKDGYTLFMASSANLTNQAINPNVSFDMVKDFAPIALATSVPIMLVTHPSSGVNSLQDLVALAKSKPGEVLYASTGVGTAPHLSGELFAQRAGVKLVHVPYQGSPQAATDLLAGRVTMMFSPISAVTAHVEAGKLKALASATSKRPLIAPNVPTMAEAGNARFRHQHLVRAGRTGGHAARNRRQAVPRGRRSAEIGRSRQDAAHTGLRGDHRRPGRVCQEHAKRDQALERRRTGGRAQALIRAAPSRGPML